MIKRPAPDRQRQRVLSEDEVRAVWKALDEEHPIIAALFRIRLLTAQRGSEVHGASWEEMDLTTGWWTIPGERSKNGLDHRVPLSPQALRILKDLHNITEKSKSKSKMGVPEHPKNWPPHQSRAKSDRAHRQSLRRGVQGSRLAAHRGQSDDRRRCAAARRVEDLESPRDGRYCRYDRHSYDPEKRSALDFWGRRLEAILANKRDARVLTFEARR